MLCLDSVTTLVCHSPRVPGVFTCIPPNAYLPTVGLSFTSSCKTPGFGTLAQTASVKHRLTEQRDCSHFSGWPQPRTLSPVGEAMPIVFYSLLAFQQALKHLKRLSIEEVLTRFGRPTLRVNHLLPRPTHEFTRARVNSNALGTL